MVNANVTVLRATREAPAVGREGERVDGAEVALDGGDLGLRDQVEEAGLEVTGARVGGRHLGRVLATTENDLSPRCENAGKQWLELRRVRGA